MRQIFLFLFLFNLIWPFTHTVGQSIKAYQTQPVVLEILSIYEKNPKVWGTYRLNSESVYQIQGKQKSLLKKISNRFFQESMLFEKNRLFFIHNQSNVSSKGQLAIKSFPYQIAKTRLTIELYRNKKDYFDLNYSKLNMIVSNLSTTSEKVLSGPTYLHIGNMDCNKASNKFVCKTSLTLSLI